MRSPPQRDPPDQLLSDRALPTRQQVRRERYADEQYALREAQRFATEEQERLEDYGLSRSSAAEMTTVEIHDPADQMCRDLVSPFPNDDEPYGAWGYCFD